MNTKTKMTMLIVIIIALICAMINLTFAMVRTIKVEKDSREAAEKATEHEINGCGGDGGFWVTDTTGNKKWMSIEMYVEDSHPTEETAITATGKVYQKADNLSQFDLDCDVKESFEILDAVRMFVKITDGDKIYYRDYARGNDGATYMVEANEDGSIKRLEDGSAIVLEKCDFADLYLPE